MDTVHYTNRISSSLRTRISEIPLPLRVVYAMLGAMATGGLALTYIFDPSEPGLFPICPFFGLTGWHCPGCGTLRAVHQLMHGNVGAAFGYNPFTMLALPAIIYSLAMGALRAYAMLAPPQVFIPARWIWALLAAILSFWLLRNLPFGPFPILAP